jgi:four helix bundle suffix protein
MSQLIRPSGGYRKTYSFGYTCLIYHATCTFCGRFYDHRNDPLGKTAGQMIGAARSARQNIVEGSSRAATSTETELRLYDVAKASLQELAGDYEAFLLQEQAIPWSQKEPRALDFQRLELAPFDPPRDDVRHAFGKYFLEMRKTFAKWIESEDPIMASNAILLTIDHASRLLSGQIRSLFEKFCREGGFTERMSRARIEARSAGSDEAATPRCPICNGPMRKVMAHRGTNAGNFFWGCLNYPQCNGTRVME